MDSNSCSLSQWCHPTISSSAIPFSSCLQSSPAPGSFPNEFALRVQRCRNSGWKTKQTGQDWIGCWFCFRCWVLIWEGVKASLGTRSKDFCFKNVKKYYNWEVSDILKNTTEEVGYISMDLWEVWAIIINFVLISISIELNIGNDETTWGEHIQKRKEGREARREGE